MTHRRVRRLALALAIAVPPSVVAPTTAAAAGCGRLAYRIEMASEEGGSWVIRSCGRQALGALLWSYSIPGQRLTERPEGDLGKRYIIVIERVRGGGGPAVVRQDYYPDAEGGPVVFAAPGQIFSHPYFEGIYTISSGWAEVIQGGTVPFALRDLGAPIPFPTPPVLTPSSEPTPAPSSDPEEASSGSGASGPDLVTLLAVGSLAAAVALLVIRKRSGS